MKGVNIDQQQNVMNQVYTERQKKLLQPDLLIQRFFISDGSRDGDILHHFNSEGFG